MVTRIIVAVLCLGSVTGGCGIFRQRGASSGVVQTMSSDTVPLGMPVDPSLGLGNAELVIQFPYQTWKSKKPTRLEDPNRILLICHPSGATIEIAAYPAKSDEGEVSPKAFAVATRTKMAKNHLIINDIASPDDPAGFPAEAGTGIYGFMYAKGKGEGPDTPAGEVIVFRHADAPVVIQVTGRWTFAYHSEMIQQLERVARSVKIETRTAKAKSKSLRA